MLISKNKVVTLSYELHLDAFDGEMIEKTETERPLVFLYGADSMLPAFEKKLVDKKVGDTFKFELSVEDAYGEASDDVIIDIPIENFVVDGEMEEGMLEKGNMIPMQDGEGNIMNGIVLETNDKTAKLDFNHPLAGEHLFFDGAVLDIREATKEEIEHGHVHGEHDEEEFEGEE